MNPFGAVGLAATLIVAAVFVAAGAAKLADRAGTRTALREFGVPVALIPLLSSALPLAELAVAALILYGPTRAVGAAGALGLLALFSVAIAVRLANGDAPSCNCFGQLRSAPVSWKTLARNGVLAVLATTALAAGLLGETPSAVAWIGNLGASSTLALVLALTALALGVTGVIAFLSLVRAHGRVLLRLDQFERALAAAGLSVEDEGETAPEFGLAPGTTAPPFISADTTGTNVSLGDLLGPELPLLLLFTSASCEACKELLPDVRTWQMERADRLTIAIFNSGDRDASLAEAQEHGLDRVLSDRDLVVYEAYQAAVTPSAVLIAADGTMASYVAAGSGSIRKLVARALAGRDDSGDRGLPVGALPPELILPTLDGESFDFVDVRKESLILFWNPGCGFCSSMREDLLAWERDPPARAPRLLIVSSGDEASVRGEGFTSTVVLDPDFKVGSAFEAGGTPMAVLLDSKGRIASPLAGGAEAVFALAGGRGRIDSGMEAPIAVSVER